jgi:uncharacterized protein YodC (DUF2158 family)
MTEPVIEFQVGDVVQLKSGSQRMVIIKVDTIIAEVIWHPFNEDHLVRDTIPLCALVKRT